MKIIQLPKHRIFHKMDAGNTKCPFCGESGPNKDNYNGIIKNEVIKYKRRFLIGFTRRTSELYHCSSCKGEWESNIQIKRVNFKKEASDDIR